MDKGHTFNGSCARTACANVGARWWNQSTRKYYCAPCATVINDVNMVDCKQLYGNRELCIKINGRGDNGPGVIRYVVTYVDKDGQRTLAHAMQGRCTYDTAGAARQWIADARANNSTDTLRQLFGEVDTLEVRPVECWAVHFDPKNCWFD